MMQHASEVTQFRNAMRQLAAGVTIITAADADGVAGMTATAVCSLTAEPPRVLACVNSGTETCQVIDRGRKMAINVLSEADEPHARAFAGMTEGMFGADRFDHADWIVDESGLPVLRTALAALICDVAMILNVGSHGVTVGDVSKVAHVSSGKPLLYAGAGFAALMPRPLTQEPA